MNNLFKLLKANGSKPFLIAEIGINHNGIFNLAGPESFSRYQIFEKLYKEYSKFKKKKVELIYCKFKSYKFSFCSEYINL